MKPPAPHVQKYGPKNTFRNRTGLITGIIQQQSDKFLVHNTSGPKAVRPGPSRPGTPMLPDVPGPKTPNPLHALARHLSRGPSHAAASTCHVSFSTKSPPRPNRTQIPRARQKTADPQRLLLPSDALSMMCGPRQLPYPTGHGHIRRQTPRPVGNHLEESQSAPGLHVTSCPTRSPRAHPRI